MGIGPHISGRPQPFIDRVAVPLPPEGGDVPVDAEQLLVDRVEREAEVVVAVGGPRPVRLVNRRVERPALAADGGDVVVLEEVPPPAEEGGRGEPLGVPRGPGRFPGGTAREGRRNASTGERGRTPEEPAPGERPSGRGTCGHEP